MQTQLKRRRNWTRQPEAPAASKSLAVEGSPISIRYRATAAAGMHSAKRRRSLGLLRAVNVVVAALGIIVTAPLMLIIAIAVRLTSRGPVIFKQPRVGIDRRRVEAPEVGRQRRQTNRGGRIFTMYKFRTMRQRPMGPQVWSSASDPRVTPIGRVLRATRLDELPQFFNVLGGDMNIVGPRPEQPEIFEELRGEVGRYDRRQRVLPGITGLAQVHLGYDQSVDDVKKKVEFDLEYIRKRSARRDLAIMAKTIPVMVFRKVWM